jgi:hypothetical protein
MAKQKGKEELVDLAGTLTAGIQKHLANGQLTFAGGTFTAAEIESRLALLIALRAAVNAARAATSVKVAAEAAQAPALVAFMSALVQCIRVQFGTQADVLADFGLVPRKVAAPLTVEQKAAAAAKREATRAARGTKSAKAKKGIKGAVTGVVLTPIVAGAPVVQATPVAAPNGAAAAATAPKTA